MKDSERGQTTIRLPVELLGQLQSEADRRGISFNAEWDPLIALQGSPKKRQSSLQGR